MWDIFPLFLFFGGILRGFQGLIRRFQPVIEDRIAGGPEKYNTEKDKYFQKAWSGEPFKNKVTSAVMQ